MKKNKEKENTIQDRNTRGSNNIYTSGMQILEKKEWREKTDKNNKQKKKAEEARAGWKKENIQR